MKITNTEIAKRVIENLNLNFYKHIDDVLKLIDASRTPREENLFSKKSIVDDFTEYYNDYLICKKEAEEDAKELERIRYK